MAEVNIIHQWS